MEEQGKRAVRRRKTRRPIQTPRGVANAVARLFGSCRRRAFRAEQTGDEKAKHVWLQLAQIGDCAVEWILPVLQDETRHAVRESELSGKRYCGIQKPQDILARK